MNKETSNRRERGILRGKEVKQEGWRKFDREMLGRKVKKYEGIYGMFWSVSSPGNYLYINVTSVPVDVPARLECFSAATTRYGYIYTVTRSVCGRKVSKGKEEREKE